MWLNLPNVKAATFLTLRSRLQNRLQTESLVIFFRFASNTHAFNCAAYTTLFVPANSCNYGGELMAPYIIQEIFSTVKAYEIAKQSVNRTAYITFRSYYVSSVCGAFNRLIKRKESSFCWWYRGNHCEKRKKLTKQHCGRYRQCEFQRNVATAGARMPAVISSLNEKRRRLHTVLAIFGHNTNLQSNAGPVGQNDHPYG